MANMWLFLNLFERMIMTSKKHLAFCALLSSSMREFLNLVSVGKNAYFSFFLFRKMDIFFLFIFSNKENLDSGKMMKMMKSFRMGNCYLVSHEHPIPSLQHAWRFKEKRLRNLALTDAFNCFKTKVDLF